jgi:hypothetical protein
MTPRRLPAGLSPAVVLLRPADLTSGAGIDPPLNAAGTAGVLILWHATDELSG